ncbi:DNA polymerase alpha catalytic subunit [Anoplophora glabripennis]|nr:DNA polymerase alpha catalytic subunit [Anoplophora glabripennis]
MSESPEERRPKRSKRETSYKAKAFEKFKQLKSGNRNKYEIEELESVYETVDEKEYVKRVLSRQDDDWIVDDDGSGYVEDGRDIFDDDLDSESITKATIKGKGIKRKKKDISESAGKGNLHFMLSNMSSKKKEDTKIDDDAMLSEILGELDETSSSHTVNSKPTTSSYSFTSRKLAAKSYMKNFSLPVKKPSRSVSSVLKEVENSLTPQEDISESNIQLENNVTLTTPESTDSNNSNIKEPAPTQMSEDLNIETDLTQDFFDDDFDMTQIEEFESQEVQNTTVDESQFTDELQSEFMSEWEHFANEVNDLENNTLLDKTDIPLLDVDDKKVFRFFWWDAYEDPEKQKGVVFLFGKTYSEKTKNYVSCCVAVRNIYRRLFLLPRPYELGADGKPTDEPVTFKKLYDEVNDNILKPLNISSFKTRYVSKKYAFNPEIPSESDYMELRYPATDPRININNLKQKPKTFSRIFGSNTSYLEILLLDRKIKGPCWLDISNPVPVSNPITWCKFEVNCMRLLDLNITSMDKPLPPPPLVVMAINLRSFINPKTYTNEILMVSCLTHTKYAVDKQAPNPPFQQHFCVFSCPTQQVLPLNIHEALKNYKATKVQKMDSERALMNYFISQFVKIDPDLIVGHDLQGYQINILSERLSKQDNKNFSKLGRLKRFEKKRLERTLFVGRLVCDIKVSAKELIRSRSYDLGTLCQAVLKINDNQRVELEPEEIPKMYQKAEDILKLISFTMQDTAYILKIMYDLNVIPLALQITNIAGNVMSRTLMGGRSERNEFLLLHAFSEKDYIVPDKEFKKKETDSSTSRKKPTYSGGLVLDPKIGFYDKLILLMDFNSLYPSIIQEYNICFITLPVSNSEDNLVLPDRSLPPGILPTEIRKLVESRRQVKSLMNNPDISNDLRIQYNIRQMALKLTANSMYGCLGFSNSRFYAKNLAALITHKGREILTNTRDLVKKMNYDVVYGDTDSIMINTNCLDYDQVFKIGLKIKQEVNKLYKQVELDIDGVFKFLLLLKKKKYAAITLTKTKDGKLKTEKEYKGLDIVRRDWSQLACETGKYILNHILSDLSPDDRVNNIHTYLTKIKEDLEQNQVPISLLVITKQLTKDPKMYTDKNTLPHVQVALRYNQHGGHFRAGDTVPYVICDDGSGKPATQRAYHVDELKNSETLKIDVQYYLAQQIHPVVTRICEPIEGTDLFHIAECLGLDMKMFKKPRQVYESTGENITRSEVKFRDVDKFIFKCLGCKQENVIDKALVGNVPFIEKCNNIECNVRPIDYLPYIQNQLSLLIQSYITKYYENRLICEDPACPNETTRIPLKFARKYPVCTMCQSGVMYRLYSEQQLYTQLTYFQHIFDLNKLSKRPLLEQHVESGYHALRENVENYLNHSGYSVINLSELFSGFMIRNKQPGSMEKGVREEKEVDIEEVDEEKYDSC